MWDAHRETAETENPGRQIQHKGTYTVFLEIEAEMSFHFPTMYPSYKQKL